MLNLLCNECSESNHCKPKHFAVCDRAVDSSTVRSRMDNFDYRWRKKKSFFFLKFVCALIVIFSEDKSEFKPESKDIS